MSKHAVRHVPHFCDACDTIDRLIRLMCTCGITPISFAFRRSGKAQRCPHLAERLCCSGGVDHSRARALLGAASSHAQSGTQHASPPPVRLRLLLPRQRHTHLVQPPSLCPSARRAGLGPRRAHNKTRPLCTPRADTASLLVRALQRACPPCPSAKAASGG